jgi:hypothetical protein
VCAIEDICVIHVEVIAIGKDAAEEQVVIATVIGHEDAPLPNEAPAPFDHGKGDDGSAMMTMVVTVEEVDVVEKILDKARSCLHHHR